MFDVDHVEEPSDQQYGTAYVVLDSFRIDQDAGHKWTWEIGLLVGIIVDIAVRERVEAIERFLDDLEMAREGRGEREADLDGDRAGHHLRAVVALTHVDVDALTERGWATYALAIAAAGSPDGSSCARTLRNRLRVPPGLEPRGRPWIAPGAQVSGSGRGAVGVAWADEDVVAP
jgi:hypothetical protein